MSKLYNYHDWSQYCVAVKRVRSDTIPWGPYTHDYTQFTLSVYTHYMFTFSLCQCPLALIWDVSDTLTKEMNRYLLSGWRRRGSHSLSSLAQIGFCDNQLIVGGMILSLGCQSECRYARSRVGVTIWWNSTFKLQDVKVLFVNKTLQHRHALCFYTTSYTIHIIHVIVCLQQIQTDFERFSIEPELHQGNISKQWDRFTIAQQEKDMAIQAEITRYAYSQ